MITYTTLNCICGKSFEAKIETPIEKTIFLNCPKCNTQHFIVSPFYKNGYNAGRFGANTENCNISNFDTREHTNEWELGNKKGIKDKEVLNAK